MKIEIAAAVVGCQQAIPAHRRRSAQYRNAGALAQPQLSVAASAFAKMASRKLFSPANRRKPLQNKGGGGLLFLAHNGPTRFNPIVDSRKVISMKQMSKSELIQTISEQHSNVTRKDVKGIIESLATVGYKELKKSGAFVLPGFAKFVVVKKPATKARKGINPFTKEPTIFKAKPARKLIKARPVKAVKDAV
jgi:DNA-binding protein HU-beta